MRVSWVLAFPSSRMYCEAVHHVPPWIEGAHVSRGGADPGRAMCVNVVLAQACDTWLRFVRTWVSPSSTTSRSLSGWSGQPDRRWPPWGGAQWGVVAWGAVVVAAAVAVAAAVVVGVVAVARHLHLHRTGERG